MPALLVRLLNAYARHGYRVRTGLNPLYFGDPDASFTRLFDARGSAVSVGAGLAPQELHFLECLFDSGQSPDRVLVVGNAFGWSTIALGMLLPHATIVAMDAGLEGNATTIGADLTRALAGEEQLDVRLVDALSPRDVTRVVHREFGSKGLDFVLVDGLHVNEQLSRDFEAAAAHAAPGCVFVLHDVLSWHMVAAFRALPIGPDCERRILTRCPSGMGVVFPRGIGAATRDVIDAFADDTVDLGAFHASVGATPEAPGPVLTLRLAPGWKMRRLGLAGTHEMEGDVEAAARQLAEVAATTADDADVLFEIAAYHIDRQRWHLAETPLRRARALAPERAEFSQQLGRVLRELGHHEDACRFFEEASRLRPQWAIPLYDLGLICQRLAGDAAAIPYFERARVLDRDWLAPCLELGAAFYRSGDDKRAIPVLEEATRLEPTSAAAEHLLGLAKARRDGDRAGVGHLARAAALNPESPFIQFDLGAARFRLAEYPEAIEHFSRAAERGGAWAAPYHLLGLAKRHLGGERAGLPELERALTLDPENSNLLFDVGSGRFHADDFDGAVPCLTRAFEANPQLTGAAHLLGLAMRQRGDDTAAVAWLERAAALAPDSAFVLYDLAMTKVRLHNDVDAHALFRQAIACAPNWAIAYREGGACASRLGEWKDASEWLVKAVELGHADDTLFDDLAPAALQARDWARALAAFTVLRRAAPDTSSLDKDIAICLRELGRFDESVAMLLAALRLQPEWAGAHYELGCTYEAQGNLSLAEGAYRRASALRPTWLTARAALNNLRRRRGTTHPSALG